MNPLLFIENDLQRHELFETARAAHQSGRDVWVRTRQGMVPFAAWLKRRA